MKNYLYALFQLYRKQLHPLSLLAGMLTLIGCSDPLEELVKENTGAIITKSVVIVCSDSYIGTTVNGVYMEIYNGTHCWSTSGGGGGGSGSYPSGPTNGGSEPYIPNGYPIYNGGGSGSGGSGFGTGNDWRFTFQPLKPIYAANSTLNLVEKDALAHVLQLITYAVPKQYTNLYTTLKNKLELLKQKIAFKMNPNSLYQAKYNMAAKSITFKTEDAINFFNLGEELIHATQHLCFYGENMNAIYKNYEFEAFVFRDLANHLVDTTRLYYAINYSGVNTNLAAEYMEWIDSLATHVRYFPRGEAYNFNRLCQMWPIDGDTLPGFAPLLLQKYFDRPLPPTP